MKQKKFGQKVQNWHRPLDPNELSARFRRYRREGVQRERLHLYEGECYDDDYHEGYFWPADDPVFQDFWRSQLCQEILYPHTPLQSLEAILPRDIAGDATREVWLPGGLDGMTFARELEHFVYRIHAYNGDDAELVATLQAAIRGSANRQIILANAPRRARTYCLFAPFWCRTPATWDPTRGGSLESHLFEQYPVPAFLNLRQDGRSVDDKWFCWRILLGRGSSLKAAAEVFEWDIPGRLPAFLSQVPPDLNPIEGCLYAEVQRLGGNETDFRRVLADPSFVFDITDRDRDDAEVDFWRESVCWIIRHREELSDRDGEMVLAWARHLYTEAQQGQRGPFRWKGRSLPAVLEQSRAYYQQWARFLPHLQGNLSWPAHGWDWEPEEEALLGWSVTELTTTAQLHEEGRAMYHCVGGYGGRCAQGFSAIVSVRYQGERRVTVEVEPRTGRIAQVRGCYNRRPDKEEVYVTAAWHAHIVALALESAAAETTEIAVP
jgi:hypothetical protein